MGTIIPVKVMVKMDLFLAVFCVFHLCEFPLENTLPYVFPFVSFCRKFFVNTVGSEACNCQFLWFFFLFCLLSV